MNDADARNLARLREQIDDLDEMVVDLIAQRFDKTRMIGEIKVRTALISTDPARRAHRAVLLNALAKRRGLDAELVLSIYRPINEEVVASHRRMGAPDPQHGGAGGLA